MEKMQCCSSASSHFGPLHETMMMKNTKMVVVAVVVVSVSKIAMDPPKS